MCLLADKFMHILLVLCQLGRTLGHQHLTHFEHRASKIASFVTCHVYRVHLRAACWRLCAEILYRPKLCTTSKNVRGGPSNFGDIQI